MSVKKCACLLADADHSTFFIFTKKIKSRNCLSAFYMLSGNWLLIFLNSKEKRLNPHNP